MASSTNLSKDGNPDVSDLDQITEAWEQIAKGEKTAQALENNLTSLEKKIDDLLASFEESERLKVEEANRKSPGSTPQNDAKGKP